jgi:UDP-N-acetylglucosamine 2-epimerase (non-hydrolysing)
MATERMKTLESEATIVSGVAKENIVEAVTLAVSLPWSARYEFEEDYSPSSVVVNAIRTQITNCLEGRRVEFWNTST